MNNATFERRKKKEIFTLHAKSLFHHEHGLITGSLRVSRQIVKTDEVFGENLFWISTG